MRDEGHDAVRTLDLPNGNRTSDAEINAISDRDGRVQSLADAGDVFYKDVPARKKRHDGEKDALTLTGDGALDVRNDALRSPRKIVVIQRSPPELDNGKEYTQGTKNVRSEV